MARDALAAAEELAKQGVNTTVVNARFCKPLDAELLSRVAGECGYVLTVEEGVRMGGFGSALLEMLQEKGRTDVRVAVHGLPDHFIEHGDPKIHKAKLGLDAPGIVNKVQALLREEGLAAAPAPANGNGGPAKPHAKH
jgi:1-deoxy-D-xylulose-5-phosphate synthase